MEKENTIRSVAEIKEVMQQINDAMDYKNFEEIIKKGEQDKDFISCLSPVRKQMWELEKKYKRELIKQYAYHELQTLRDYLEILEWVLGERNDWDLPF